MSQPIPPVKIVRPFRAAVSAAALLLVTVSLGGALGLLTQAQFREVQQSWIDYSEGAERKGILISDLRELLGYGGIIHNFKNYVLRQETSYLAQTEAQIAEFDDVVARFRALTLNDDESRALGEIEQTIGAYATNLALAFQAAASGATPGETDSIVRVDDQPAIAALAVLETSWEDVQDSSTKRLLAAVGQGQYLIWIGFLSIVALVLAALLVGWLLWRMFGELRRTVGELAAELAERQRLEVSEGRLATAVEQSPATMIMTDTKARIQYVNAKFTEITGWTLNEVRGKTPAFLQSGDTDSPTYRELRAGLARGETWHGVFRNRKKDGSSYWAETTVLPLLGPDGAIQSFIGIGEDVTEQRQARDQMIRAQKLEAVGQLAGGVAHDFNNILTTIIGSAHLADMDAPKGSDLAGEIAQIDIAARRAQNLIRELLTFARREPGNMRSVNIGTIIDEVTGLLKASVSPAIDIRFEDASEPLFVHSDPTHLHQIVMNLCRNAAEAMAGAAGEVVIGIAPLETAENSDAHPLGLVRLTVADNGPGMSADTQRHLFEPFFTTKPLGKSSGLGLSVVYGLVGEMNGDISFETELGAGCTFTIDLPRATPAEEDTVAADQPLPRGRERILLVDDQTEVLGTFRRLLTRLGYQVEAFSSPAAAYERFQANPARFDIVMSDMVMPGMSGEELSIKLRALAPEIPVIFCSAYKPRQLNVPGPKPTVIDKPVQPMHLATELRRLLDAPTAR
jgi:PAS domain S-box-containing protein